MTDSDSRGGLRALALHEGDDVAVMVGDGARGAACAIHTAEAHVLDLALATDVPFGHKVALRDIRQGESVRKYGQPIAVAVVDIPAGAHVHVHNIEGHRSGLRGGRR